MTTVSTASALRLPRTRCASLGVAPVKEYAMLLNEVIDHDAARTKYRVLAAHAEVRERRAQRRRAVCATLELLAVVPNQLWSWDITKLIGPTTWSWYNLGVTPDVFIRYVVGWMIASDDSAALAEQRIGSCCAREGIAPELLTLPADRGSSMTSKPVAFLLGDLGVTKSYLRPHVAHDSP